MRASDLKERGGRSVAVHRLAGRCPGMSCSIRRSSRGKRALLDFAAGGGKNSNELRRKGALIALKQKGDLGTRASECRYELDHISRKTRHPREHDRAQRRGQLGTIAPKGAGQNERRLGRLHEGARIELARIGIHQLEHALLCRRLGRHGVLGAHALACLGIIARHGHHEVAGHAREHTHRARSVAQGRETPRRAGIGHGIGHEHLALHGTYRNAAVAQERPSPVQPRLGRARLDPQADTRARELATGARHGIERRHGKRRPPVSRKLFLQVENLRRGKLPALSAHQSNGHAPSKANRPKPVNIDRPHGSGSRGHATVPHTKKRARFPARARVSRMSLSKIGGGAGPTRRPPGE